MIEKSCGDGNIVDASADTGVGVRFHVNGSYAQGSGPHGFS